MEKEKIWKRHISSWRMSGESAAAYCRREGLASSTFDYWRKRVEGDQFIRVGEPPRIELVLSDGTILRVPAEAKILQTVLEALDAAARR